MAYWVLVDVGKEYFFLVKVCYVGSLVGSFSIRLMRLRVGPLILDKGFHLQESIKLFNNFESLS